MKEYKLNRPAKQPCKHTNERITLTPDGPHYAKKTCASCNAFIAWLPKPETAAKRQEILDRLGRIAAFPLKGWNKTFIEDMLTRNGKTSPRQLEQIERIESELGIQ